MNAKVFILKYKKKKFYLFNINYNNFKILITIYYNYNKK